MEALLQLLHAVHPLTPKLNQHLRAKIKKFTFKKGQIIFKEGVIASRILYLEEGLIRSFSIVNGKKASNYFMRQGDIIISVESFFQQIPAYDTIVALEDCVCWGITYDELEETYQKFTKFNTNGRRIVQVYYCKSEARHRTRQLKKPELMYKEIMEADPDLLSRVRDNYVASYLNVSKATYSGIKRRYVEMLRISRSKNVQF